MRMLRRELPVPLCLENIAWAEHRRLTSSIMDPRFLAEFASDFSDGLVLDIAHARCCAQALGCTIVHYSDRLTEGYVREIHSAGTAVDSGGTVVDAHCRPSEEDLRLTKYALERCEASVSVITLEYGNERRAGSGRYAASEPTVAALAEALDALWSIIN
jgi:uncharacterized protein (UPF0276 family)